MGNRAINHMMGWKSVYSKKMFHSDKKGCTCGRHNASNRKGNKHHNSTRQRLGVKVARKFIFRLNNRSDTIE